MRVPRAPIAGAAPPIVLGVVAWILFPTHRAVVVELTVVALLAVILIKIVRDAGALRASRPSLFDRRLDRSDRGMERPDDLVKVERILGWRSYDARDWHRRVRPLLKELVCYRVRARYGVDPQEDPEAARRFLPPELVDVLGISGEKDPYGTARIHARFVSKLVTQIEEL